MSSDIQTKTQTVTISNMFIETDTKSPQAKSKGASFDISVRPAIPALGRAPSTTSPSCIPPPQQPSHSIINHQSSAARNHPAGASGASPHGSPSGVTAPTKFTPSGTVAASSANSTGSDPPAGVSPAELSSSSSPPPHPPPPPPVASASAPAQPPAPTIPIHIPPQASLDFVDRLMTPPSGYPTETRRRGRQATACLECNRRKQKVCVMCCAGGCHRRKGSIARHRGRLTSLPADHLTIVRSTLSTRPTPRIRPLPLTHSVRSSPAVPPLRET